PQAEQPEVGQQTLPVQLTGAADGFATQADQREQLRGERIARAAGKACAIAILLPDRKHQTLQSVVEQIEEGACRIAILAVTQSLLAIECRQRRGRAEQSDQIDPQTRAQLALLLEELHLIDIAA